MVSMTLSIPEDLKKKMDKFPEINWSEIARQAIIQRINDFVFMKEFVKDSTMTEEDALRLGKLVNKAMAEKYNLMKKRKSSE